MPADRFSPAATWLRSHDSEFRLAVQHRLMRDYPEAFGVFPRGPQQSHLDLPTVLAWVLERTLPDGRLPTEVLDRLTQLGRNHRRFGFPSPIYQAFGQVLRETLTDLAPDLDPAAGQVLDDVCAALAAASISAAQAGEPAAYSGEVIDVRRMSRRVSVVTVDCGLPLPYQAGQHVLATSPYLPGRWLPLCPTLPPSDFGQLEFYIQSDEGEDYQVFGHARPGDRWTFGQPAGTLQLPDAGPTVIMVAHGPGIAPLRALIFAQLDQPNPPHVELYLGAEYPGELVEYSRLRGLAAADWLNIIPFASHDQDPWWVSASTPPPADLVVTDNIAAVILAQANRVHDHVIVAGPAKVAAGSIATFTAAGIANVHYESWSLNASWV